MSGLSAPGTSANRQPGWGASHFDRFDGLLLKARPVDSLALGIAGGLNTDRIIEKIDPERPSAGALLETDIPLLGKWTAAYRRANFADGLDYDR